MQDTNQVKRAIELDKASGKFAYDDGGYLRFTPSDEELAAINAYLGQELSDAMAAHRPLFDEAQENIETYRAVKTRLKDGDEAVLPSPIARAPADQIIASTVNVIMKAKPIVSVDPFFPATYTVIAPFTPPAPAVGDMGMQPGMPGMGGGMGMMQPQIPVPIDADAETIALRFEQGLEFKNRQKLDFGRYIHEIVQDCVTGAPPFTKVCRERKRRPIIVPKVNGAEIDFSEKEERYVNDGEEVRYYRVPMFNMLRPNLDEDVDDLDWIAERTPKPPGDITAGFHAEDYFLIENAEEADKLSKDCSSPVDPAQEQLAASTRKWHAERRPMCDVYEVWFYRHLKVIDPDTGKKTVKKFSLMGMYHYGAKKLLNCFRNPYDHQRRPYVPFQQFLDGSSTVSVVKYNQHVGTHIIQSEIKNAYHANNFTYWYDPNDPDITRFFKNRSRLNPGDVIPGKEGETWGVVRAGAQHYSLLGLAQWNAGTAQEASNVSDYESGRTIPGRTPSSTVAQILEQGGQQQILFLAGLGRQVEKVMRLYLETCRQFSPLGETIPVRDEQVKNIMLVPMRYPVGEVLDNFSIQLTAAAEAAAKERDQENQSLLLDMYQRHTSFVAQVVGPMLNPELTPDQREFYRKTLEGEQILFNRIIAQQRTDEEKFDLQKTIDAMAEEANAAAQQMKEMEAMGADQTGMGGMPGQGGGMPGGGPPGSGGQPPMGDGAPPPPA